MKFRHPGRDSTPDRHGEKIHANHYTIGPCINRVESATLFHLKLSNNYYSCFAQTICKSITALLHSWIINTLILVKLSFCIRFWNTATIAKYCYATLTTQHLFSWILRLHYLFKNSQDFSRSSLFLSKIWGTKFWRISQ